MVGWCSLINTGRLDGWESLHSLVVRGYTFHIKLDLCAAIMLSVNS